MAFRAIPSRTCVGCRARAPKPELVRVVVAGTQCVPDLRGRLQGRGAYVHGDPACLDLAERRRAFLRAFRVPGPLDVTPVRRLVSEQQNVPAASAAGSPVREQVEKR